MYLNRSFSSFVSLIWLCTCIGHVCGHLPLELLHPSRVYKKQSPGPSPYAINGVQTGGVLQRIEIRQLQQNQPLWNIYLLALKRLQTTNQSELLSYYQISGIHGRPFTSWDGVLAAGDENSGYCTHSSILFPTWHRSYLALFEQVLYEIVQKVASEFKNTEYTAAAETFRIPYWDWAASAPSGQNTLPSSVAGSAYITLSLPNGSEVISNPLYQYTFNPLSPNELPDYPFNIWQNTLRGPTTLNSSAISQNPQIIKNLDQSQSSFSQNFMNLLQSYPLYGNFSNKAWFSENGPGSYSSLESLHDDIHGMVGGNNGHMAVIDYSSFDPIFWLHHVNVDRLFAIWQAIYPDSYVEPTIAQYETFTINVNDTEDENSPLKPFYNDRTGDFWTSSSARSTINFGYNYPETQNQKSGAVKQAVNALYSVSADTFVSRQRRKQRRHSVQRASDLASYIADGFGITSVDRSQKIVDTSNTYREWITNIRVPQYALGGTFFIHIFLGDFSPDAATWNTEPNLVGTHTVLKRFPVACQNCNQNVNSHLIVTGTVPLTRALLKDFENGEVDETGIEAVEKYLQQKLKWRVTKLDGSSVLAGKVQGLKVSVVSSLITRAESEYEFPTWGDFTVHRDVTHGRPAGLHYEDDA